MELHVFGSDRLMVNAKWTDGGLNCSVTHLCRAPSDHAPLLISISSRRDSGVRSFRFLNFWSSHQDFLGIVRESWGSNTLGSSMYHFLAKLKRVKNGLRVWSKETFRNVFSSVQVAEARVVEAELRRQQGESEDSIAGLKLAQAELLRVLAIEDSFWKQKAHVKWLA